MTARPMLLDAFLPDFHATRIEHLVAQAPPAAVFAAATHVDFLDVARRHGVVRGLFALRSAAERVAATVRRTPIPDPPDLPALRLADLPRHGDWVRLAEEAPSEIVFGVVGRFWSGETSWVEIDADAFTAFDAPGYAKIAANLSLRPYGAEHTLISYEARTCATDDAARREFLRYWTVVSPGVGIVMRATLALIAEASAASA